MSHVLFRVKGGPSLNGFTPKYGIQNDEVPTKVWVLKPVTDEVFDVELIKADEIKLGGRIRGYSHIEPNLSVEEIYEELSKFEKV